MYVWFYVLLSQFLKRFFPIFQKFFTTIPFVWVVHKYPWDDFVQTNVLRKSVNINHVNMKWGKNFWKGAKKLFKLSYPKLITCWNYIEIRSLWVDEEIMGPVFIMRKVIMWKRFFSSKWRIFKGKTVSMRSWKVRFLKKEIEISRVAGTQNFSNWMNMMTFNYLDDKLWIENVMIKYSSSLVIWGELSIRRWNQI